jgi:hypothetical protein
VNGQAPSGRLPNRRRYYKESLAMAEAQDLQASELMELRLIDRFLLASWVYSFAVLLWVFRVIKRMETPRRKVGVEG